MKILDAEISGFKIYKAKKSFAFGQVNRISGGNGKGKTTFAEAIVWCFYGCDLSGSTKGSFERLKNKSSKEVKVKVGVELPESDGTLSRFEFCRIRKGRITSLFLNGHDAKQVDFDGLLGPMELFLSIFVPGYFGTIAMAEPTKARNMLVSMLPKLNHADVFSRLNEDDQACIEAIDMVNPEHALKTLRSEIAELDKALDNVQGKIDYLRVNSMLDVPLRVVEGDNHRLAELKSKLSSAMMSYESAKPDLLDLTPLLEKRAELRFQYERILKEYKTLRDKPLPKAGDRCPECNHEHTEEEARAENKSRQERLVELREDLEAIKGEGVLLAEEIEDKEKANEVALAEYQAKREESMKQLQADIELLSPVVSEREAKLKMAKDLEEQHEVYGEIVTERDQKKAAMQAVKNFMLQYAEMQVSYVNSFLNLAKIQLFKYSSTTGEMMLDFTITYGEEETEYKALSTSEKIRCSIELAELMNRVRNVSYPVYIDNAESLESFDEPKTQYFVASVVPRAKLQNEVVVA